MRIGDSSAAVTGYEIPGATHHGEGGRVGLKPEVRIPGNAETVTFRIRGDRIMRFFPFIIAVMTAVFPLAAQGEYAADENAVEQLPQLVVSATRIPTSADLGPSSITVISREEIERSAAHDVAELLRFVPGADVRITGQTGGQTSVFLRGANSNHTLVLIDGIRANSAFSGTYDFSDLSVANVERVEVITGPQSLLYGSEALGGIINIVTRRGSQGASGSLSVAAGSHEWAEGRGFASFGGTKVSGSVSGSWLQTDNSRDNSAYRAGDFAVSGDWKVSPSLALGLQASMFDSKSGIPNDRFTNDPNDEGRTKNQLAAFTLAATPWSWWDLGLTVSNSRDELDFDGPEPNPPYYSGDVSSTTKGKRSQVDLQNILALAPGHQLLLGGTYEEVDAEHASSSSFGDTELDPDQVSRSVFGAYGWRGGDRFELNCGARLDDYSTFGTHETWRLGGRLNVPAGIAFRGNIGTGFRAPSLADLYYPGFSNPGLVPEESLGWDLGLEGPLNGEVVRIRATWFSNQFTNLIAYSTDTYRPENIAEARTEGLEATLDWKVGAGWTVRASYTWLPTAEDETKNSRLLRRAEHSGSLNLFGQVLDALALDARLLAVGSSADMDFSSIPAAEATNAGYVKVDLGATYRLATKLSVMVRAENLFDVQFEETYGYPALGQVFRGGATLDF